MPLQRPSIPVELYKLWALAIANCGFRISEAVPVPQHCGLLVQIEEPNSKCEMRNSDKKNKYSEEINYGKGRCNIQRRQH
jgi:hypothetical protein